MAATGGTPIILYHSTTASAVPSNTNLAAGELGLNIADMKLYCENDSAVVTLLASADAAAGNFTTVDTTNLEVTNIKAKDGTAAVVLTDSTGAVTVSTELSVDNVNINGNTIVSSDTDGDLNLTPNGTGDLVLDGLKWPQADGTADYVLKTNGSGQLSWTAQTGGGGGGGGTSVTVTQATATASQTDFSVTYTVGQLSVYLNGALLAAADYTATNGTTVVLAAGAAANDIFTALAYSTVAGLEIESASPYLTAVGSGAGAVNTGVNNVFVGFEAGNDNTTGTNNTAVGYQALDANTTGGNNTALGSGALGANTTTANNTAVGYAALSVNTQANNTAIGSLALQDCTTGYNNTTLGYRAATNLTTGASNISLGDDSMFTSTTANDNTAVGSRAMFYNETGSSNTAVGRRALETNTTASNNTAIGFSALFANTTGAGNVAVGYAALDANTIGSNAVAIGLNAFGSFNRTTDSSSPGVAIGSGAGSGVTTGYNNVIIGVDAGTSFTTGVFGMYIGQNTTASAGGATDEMVIGTRGGTGKGNGTGFINPNTGGVYQGNNSSSWSTTSDQRLKKNIVDNTEGLEKINALRVRNFEYRTEEEITELDPTCAINKAGVQLGVIAQEIQQVCPDCVKEESTGVLSVDSDNVFWHMVNAIKELSAKCDALQAEINTLKGQ